MPKKGKKSKKNASNVFAMFEQSQIQEFKEAFGMIDQGSATINLSPKKAVNACSKSTFFDFFSIKLPTPDDRLKSGRFYRQNGLKSNIRVAGSRRFRSEFKKLYLFTDFSGKFKNKLQIFLKSYHF